MFKLLPIRIGGSSFTHFFIWIYHKSLSSTKFFPLQSSKFAELFDFSDDNKRFWLSVLTLANLLLKLSLKGKFKRGQEIYSPKYCACQFRLIQGLPSLVLYSMEYPFDTKNMYVVSDKFDSFKCCYLVTMRVLNKYTMTPFVPYPNVTTQIYG